MINHSHYTATAVLTRQTNIHFILAVFRVVSYTCGRDLTCLEVDKEVVSEVELINV